MSRAFLYVFKQYLKNFFVTLFALVFIITLIDYVQHIKSIAGINRAFLYIYYTASNVITIIYPIALVFGAVMTMSSLLFKNHLVALSSFGYKKSSVAKPILLGVFLLYLTVVGLNFTKFAYAGDKAEAVLNDAADFKSVDNIFFKYNNSFVSAKSMDVVNKKLKDVTLYYINSGRLRYLMEFKEATFNDGSWLAKDITKKSLEYIDNRPNGYTLSHIDSSKILEGYYPKVVRLLYEGKRMSIQDGFKAMSLLDKQNIDSSKIRAALYERVIMPLFAPFLVLIIVMLTPIHQRYFSKSKFYLYSLGGTLVVWSLLYSSNMMSQNGAISAIFGQPLVVLILAIISIVVFVKRRNRI